VDDTAHQIDRIEASHLVPPVGESIDCEICGFLCNMGTGYGAHVRAEHSAKDWERIKKALLSAKKKTTAATK